MKTRYLWTVVAIAAIWLAVLLTSLFSPDFVSGTEQEHLKIPALLNWLWGAMATVSIMRMHRHRRAKLLSDGSWITLGMGTALIWLAATMVSIFVPEMETGTDPTRIPLAALISPIVAMVFTRYLAEFLVEGGDVEEERTAHKEAIRI